MPTEGEAEKFESLIHHTHTKHYPSSDGYNAYKKCMKTPRRNFIRQVEGYLTVYKRSIKI